jgi:hydroxymethylglutaryl-CoA lyase
VNVQKVELHEVGPREGFQFEGIGQPEKIPTTRKVELVQALATTGLRKIQVTSFVSPKQVPQMADAEEVSRRLQPVSGLEYDCVYLNDKGLERALNAGIYTIEGHVSLSASEAFSKRNQNRTLAEDIEMQRRQLHLYRANNIPIEGGRLMAAFGCNYEGDIPLSRVIDLVVIMHDLIAEGGGQFRELQLADTMGWADPESVTRTVHAVRSRWPELKLSLHLHDTRGAGLANFYAGLESGVTKFDTSVGGLGGCPFAQTVGGNICTEDVVFMCERMGVETGVHFERLIECSRLAEDIVGHVLPSRMSHAWGSAAT